MMSQKKISETRQKDFQKTAEERVRNFFKEHSELRKQSRQNRTLHTKNSTLSPTAPPCLPKLGVTNANINEVFKFLAKKYLLWSRLTKYGRPEMIEEASPKLASDNKRL